VKSSGEDLLDPAFVARLERIELIARRLESGPARGDLSTRRRGPGSLFREHKNYSPGDDVRFVDWNVYSRLGELLIKQFDADENLDLTLFLDVSGSMGFGRHDKLAFARRVAALVGYLGLARQATLKLAFVPRGEVAPQSYFGKQRLHPFLGDLARVETLAEEGDFFSEFKLATQRHRGRGLAVVVSDFLTPGGYEKGLDYLAYSGYRVAAVQILDEYDLRPNLKGRLRLEDLESGRQLERIVTRRMLDEYEAEVRRWCTGFQDWCRGRGVALSVLDTAWDFERVLESLLAPGGIAR
jgi:uncharacterized protein (DUF58 family)